MTILDQIRRLREYRRWTVEDMALLTRLSPTQIAAIEDGSVTPTLEELEQIAAALGMQVWLVPGEI